MIEGINHITVSVRDLDRSFEFYFQVLDFKPLLRHPKGVYLLAGDLWFCLEIDENVRDKELSEYTHHAFSVSQANFSELSAKIIRSGAKVWKDNRSEGDSLYFLDPDGHKLEIHVGDWRTRIESYRGRTNNTGMTFYV